MILPWTWTATAEAAAISTCETTNGDSKSPRGGGTQIATRAGQQEIAGQGRDGAGSRLQGNKLQRTCWATHAAIMVDHSRSVDQSLLRVVHSRLPRMIRALQKKKKKISSHSNCLKSDPPYPLSS